MRFAEVAAFVAAAALVTACGGKPTSGPEPEGSSTPASAPSAPSAPSASPIAPAEEVDPPEEGAAGDPAKGRELVAHFQCNRCHARTGEPAPKHDQQCFDCHKEIMAGTFKAPNKKLQEHWNDVVADLRDVPTLEATNKRLRRRWLVAFLQEPYDVRPNLTANMPRLGITKEQAKDLAAYLGAPEVDPKDDRAVLAGADAARGRKLIEAKGCPSCHAFSRVPRLEGTPEKVDRKTILPAISLAPDLVTTRRRMAAKAIFEWIKSPKAMKEDTVMPELPLPDDEVRDITAYITTAKLEPEAPKKPIERLPLLTRKVGFDEVAEHIFKRSCWHCHGEPDYAVGDGGPGNTGGLGFKPRGLALTDYQGVASGYLDDKGERHSVFEKMPDGTPRLLAALLARHDEEAGHPREGVRGMPLGYPAVSAEDVQLLASWIDQGRPR